MSVSDLIDPSFSYRLITTLMHFLWQGSLVALLAVLGDTLLSRTSASRRYALHVVALTIMIVCVAVTFSKVAAPVYAPSVLTTSSPIVPTTELIVQGPDKVDSSDRPSASTPATMRVEMPHSELPATVGTVEMVEPLVSQQRPSGDGNRWQQLQHYAPQIAVLYFFCCGLLLARLVRGTWVAHRLRRLATTVSDDSLIATFQRQSKELGLRVMPRIAWCAEVSIPLVIGIFQPMILLPTAAATGLSPDQLQALITHELAHIRRYDLLVNLVQRIVESLLFFHPAVWYISRRISSEREQACDELVLATGCERLRYADALVRMAELSSSLRSLRTSAPATSLAASGANSSEFKRRVLKVLLVPTTSDLQPSRIALLVIMALIVGAAVSASSLHFNVLAETPPKPTPTEIMPPDGLEFLKSYPKLHGLSLDMTEPQFLEIVRQHRLKTRNSEDRDKVQHRIFLDDGHTLIVMFDQGEKCLGIQRVRTEDLIDDSLPLADVVRDFNAENKRLGLGLAQQAVTEDEVIAVIKRDKWQRGDPWSLNEQEIAAFKGVSESKRLPKGSYLDVHTEELAETFSWKQLWQVRLMLPAIRHDGFVGLTIRDTHVAEETIDPKQVAWGKPDPDGLSLGAYLSPKKDKYQIGERVRLRLFVRNEGQNVVGNLTFYNLPTPDAKDFTVTDQTGANVVVRLGHEGWDLHLVAGARGGVLKPGDAHAFRVLYEISIGGDGSNPLVGRVIDARPGQSLQLKVRAFNGNNRERKDGDAEPESGMVTFAVAAADNAGRAGQKAETVVGTVVSPDGKPVAGVEVLAFQGEKQLEPKFVTDERGEIRVPKEWRETEHWLTLVARDGREKLGWFDFMIHGHSDIGQKADDGSFKLVLLPMSRTVRGRVVDGAGMPLAQVPVRINQLSHDVNQMAVHWRYQSLGDEPLLRGGVTDNEGRFEVKTPADSTVWLGTKHPDWVEKTIIFRKDNDDAGETKLIRAAKVAGRVTDARTGKPLAGVVIAAQAAKTEIGESGGDEAKTDADGDYRITGLRAGTYAVQLKRSLFKTMTAAAHATVELKAGESHPADFALNVGQRLAGRVLHLDTGEPIPRCKVNCTNPAQPISGLSTETDEKGDFEFFVPPGKSNVSATEGRRFSNDSTREVDVPTEGDVAPITLKVGDETETVPGSFKIITGPPLERKVRLDFKNEPFAEALKLLCDSAIVTLELDEASLTSAGYSKETPVTLTEGTSVTLQDALTRFLKPFDKLAFTFDKNKVFVSTREQVEAREKQVAEPKPPTEDKNSGATSPPKGLEFLKPYPKLHGLSLDMTEPQFLEIVKQQGLKTRKAVEGEKITQHIALGDDHTLIVMFDKDAKCCGIQRVRGEDTPRRAQLLVKYDMPGAEAETRIFVERIDKEFQAKQGRRDEYGKEEYGGVRFSRLKNGDSLTLSDLPAGKYRVARYRLVDIVHEGTGKAQHSVYLDRQWIELAEQETKSITMSRPAGQPISGRVVIPADLKINTLVVHVCSENAASSGSLNHRDVMHFDALNADADGKFKTEPLPPGRYKVLVEGYANHSLALSGEIVPRWEGTAQVTVTEPNKPAAIEVILRNFDLEAWFKDQTISANELEFLKPYPKLIGLSLDMTEPQFLEIVKQQELKTRKTVEGEKVTHHIGLGEGHTLIVMFDKDSKCSGIQRVRGESNAGGDANSERDEPKQIFLKSDPIAKYGDQLAVSWVKAGDRRSPSDVLLISVLKDGTVIAAGDSNRNRECQIKLTAAQFDELLKKMDEVDHCFDLAPDGEHVIKPGQPYNQWDHGADWLRIRRGQKEIHVGLVGSWNVGQEEHTPGVSTCRKVMARLCPLINVTRAGGWDEIERLLPIANAALTQSFPELPPLTAKDFSSSERFQYPARSIYFRRTGADGEKFGVELERRDDGTVNPISVWNGGDIRDVEKPLVVRGLDLAKIPFTKEWKEMEKLRVLTDSGYTFKPEYAAYEVAPEIWACYLPKEDKFYIEVGNNQRRRRLYGPIAGSPLKVLIPPPVAAKAGHEAATANRQRDLSLADLVRVFNDENQQLRQGLNQPALTEDEVIAVIKRDKWQREEPPLNEQEIAAFKVVAESRRLPEYAHLHLETEDETETFVWKKLWRVRLMLPAIGRDGHVGLTIRDTKVAEEKIDSKHVAWGQPDAEGLTLGIYLSPRKAQYAIGERVRLRFLVRNNGQQPVKTMWPGISVPMPEDFTVADQTGAMVAVNIGHENWDSPWTTLFKNEMLGVGDVHGLTVPYEISIGGDGSKNSLIGRVIKARPGQKLQFKVRERNGSTRKEGEAEQESGSVLFGVVAAPKGVTTARPPAEAGTEQKELQTTELQPAETQAPLRTLLKPALLLPDHWILQAVEYDNGGKELVTASNQSFITIRRWDLAGLKLLSEIKLQSDKHGRPFREGTFQFSGDRRRLVAATDAYVGIWDTTTGKLLKQLPFQTTEGTYDCAIDKLDCTPDLSVIVGHRALPGRLTLSYDAHVIVWDGVSGNVLRTVIDQGATDLKALDLSKDGKWLATTNGGGAKIWDTSTGQLRRSISNDNTGRKHSEPDVSTQYTSHVWSVQLSPDGKQLAMGDILGVKLLDATSGKVLQQLEGPYRYSSNASPGLVFSPDGQRLARLGTQEQAEGDKYRYVVPIWSTQTGAKLFVLHTEANDAAFSDDSQRLAVAFSDMQQALSVWSLNDDAVNLEKPAGPGPHSRVDRVEENGHYVGKKAAEYLEQFQPTWGEAKLGLQYGIALTKPRRQFRNGERVPHVVFFRNASDKPIKFDTAPDFFGNSPTVLNAKGEPITLETIPLLGHIPRYHEKLEPGEALGPFYLSFGLAENPRPGQLHWPPYLPSPVAGIYTLTHSVSINVAGTNAGEAAKKDEITSSTIEFEIVE